MANVQPFEIIHGPYTVYVAPTGEAYPAINATPAGNWVLLGTNGSRSMSEDGVMVSHSQDLTYVHTDGATGPVKAFRNREELLVKVTLYDCSLEFYRYVLNGNSVADTAAGAGTAGFRTLKIHRGPDVAQHAILIRGLGPYGASMNLDFRVPVVVADGEPEVVLKKDTPAGLVIEFHALEDFNASTDADRFGSLVAMDAVPV